MMAANSSSHLSVLIKLDAFRFAGFKILSTVVAVVSWIKRVVFDHLTFDEFIIYKKKKNHKAHYLKQINKYQSSYTLKMNSIQ